MFFAFRHANGAFMRVSRKILNYIGPILKHFVHRYDRCDPLVIAVTP